MMPRDLQPAAGGVRNHPVVAAIGSGLAEFFDLDRHGPMPERLVLLLERINACESGSARNAVPEPGGRQAKRQSRRRRHNKT
jgi:hypothetical protein